MSSHQDSNLRFFDLVIVILSIYVLLALLVDSFFKLSPEVSRLLMLIDNFICIVFLFDFFYRLYKAPSKLKFLKWGGLISFPAFQRLSFYGTADLSGSLEY